jgi:AcrR family transcriptional regulator
MSGRAGVAGSGRSRARVNGEVLPRGAVLPRGGRLPRGGGSPRVQVTDIQRSRLMAGAVSAVEELGYARATVGQITARARVSRRTFYELFANRDECLAAVVEDVVGQVSCELAGAGLEGLEWRERVRAGLGAILSFLDREPVLARVCVVQALRAGAGVQERREELLGRLAAVVDEGRLEGARGEGCSALTAEGLVGAAFAIVYARLLRGERRPLTGLLGELTGMIVLPYLGPAAARRERARAVPAGPTVASRAREAVVPRSARDPLKGVRMRLTYRTAKVLEGVEELAGEGCNPSNRMVAHYAGVQDPGQISKLLRRLEGLGLLANTGEGHAKGEPNAWTLTPRGERVAHSIRLHGPGQREAA